MRGSVREGDGDRAQRECRLGLSQGRDRNPSAFWERSAGRQAAPQGPWKAAHGAWGRVAAAGRESCRWPGPGGGGAEGSSKTQKGSRSLRSEGETAHSLALPLPLPPGSLRPVLLFPHHVAALVSSLLPGPSPPLCLPLFCLSTNTTPKVSGFQQSCIIVTPQVQAICGTAPLGAAWAGPARPASHAAWLSWERGSRTPCQTCHRVASAMFCWWKKSQTRFRRRGGRGADSSLSVAPPWDMAGAVCSLPGAASSSMEWGWERGLA